MSDNKVSKYQGIKNMLEYYEEKLNNGLTYNIHRFSSDTHDEEFNKAIDQFQESYDVLEAQLSKFEDELESGRYEEYLEQ